MSSTADGNRNLRKTCFTLDQTYWRQSLRQPQEPITTRALRTDSCVSVRCEFLACHVLETCHVKLGRRGPVDLKACHWKFGELQRVYLQ